VGQGSVLAGRYRLEARLESDVDGSLWRALDGTLERGVIVRVLRRDHPFAADIVDAARRAALVDDPRLARVLDVGRVDGLTYLVTEDVQGRLLEDYLREGPLAADGVRRVVGEAAQALERAASRGLHHLRLTPASICVIPDGSVKVLGTAIDAAAAGVEQDDAVLGNRTDAVALVSLVYAGLTGRWPGPADGPLGPAPQVAARAVPPSNLVPDVPADLNALCTLTLGSEDAGPRTPGELAARLSPWTARSPLRHPGGPDDAPPPRENGWPGRLVTEDPDGVADDDPRAVTTPLPRVGENADLFTATQPPSPPTPVPLAQPATALPEATGQPASAGWASAAELAGGLWGTPRRGGAWPVEPAPPSPVAEADPPRSRYDWAGGDDRLGPFLPPVPVERPPESQTRMVLGVIASLVVLGLLVSLIILRSTWNAHPLTPQSTPSRIAADPGIPSGAPRSVTTAGAGAAAGSPPITIAAVTVLDPQGDNAENDAAAPRLYDGKTGTEWRSEGYSSANFGGLGKTGLGFSLDLGRRSTVSQVIIDQRGTGGSLELRAGTGPALDGSTVLATVPLDSDRVTITLDKPATTRYLVFWFTKLTRQSTGEYRLRVFEVSVR
jgi:hypothetical protein